jgi:hypothetical protein
MLKMSDSTKNAQGSRLQLRDGEGGFAGKVV